MPLCRKLSEEDQNIFFNGRISKVSLIEEYANAFGLLVTSDSEASPTVIKEALSLGMYVFSLDVGDAKMHVDEDNGLIFRSRCDKEIASEILKFYKTRKSLQLWRHEKRTVVRDIYKEIAEIYSSL